MNSANRQRLLSIMKGGSGIQGSYIEVVHLRTPEGRDVKAEYILHCENGCRIPVQDIEEGRMIIRIGAKSYKADGALFGEEKLREAESCPVYDFGAVKTETKRRAQYDK